MWELIKESVPLDKKFGDASISKKVLDKTGVSLEKEIKILV